MIRGLFWNISGPHCLAGGERYQQLSDLLQTAVVEHTLDLVLLAESPFSGAWQTSDFTERQHNVPPNKATKCRMEVYASNRIKTELMRDFDRATIFRIDNTKGFIFLLALAHLTSKISTETDDRNEEVRTFSSGIQNLEKDINNQKTLLVGDLNHDPYEFCIQNANGLHAISSEKIAHTKHRKIKNKLYPFFYNPMWKYYGSDSPGTYFRKSSSVNCQFWYLPDQVLVRPALLDSWDEKALRILNCIGTTSLVNSRGEPLKPPTSDRNNKGVSDHLPLLFALKETKP